MKSIKALLIIVLSLIVIANVYASDGNRFKTYCEKTDEGFTVCTIEDKITYDKVLAIMVNGRIVSVTTISKSPHIKR